MKRRSGVACLTRQRPVTSPVFICTAPARPKKPSRSVKRCCRCSRPRRCTLRMLKPCAGLACVRSTLIALIWASNTQPKAGSSRGFATTRRAACSRSANSVRRSADRATRGKRSGCCATPCPPHAPSLILTRWWCYSTTSSSCSPENTIGCAVPTRRARTTRPSAPLPKVCALRAKC